MRAYLSIVVYLSIYLSRGFLQRILYSSAGVILHRRRTRDGRGIVERQQAHHRLGGNRGRSADSARWVDNGES